MSCCLRSMGASVELREEGLELPGQVRIKPLEPPFASHVYQGQSQRLPTCFFEF